MWELAVVGNPRAVLIALLVATQLACSAVAEDKPRVGLVLPIGEGMGNPLVDRMVQAARSKAVELNYELIIPPATAGAGDVPHQVTVIEDLVSANVDGIIVLPIMPDALTPVAKVAQDRGIVIVTMERPIPGVGTTVETDKFAAGVAIGQWTKGAVLVDSSKAVGMDFDSFPWAENLKKGIVSGINSTSQSIVCNAASNGDPTSAVNGLLDTCSNIAAIITPDALTGVEALGAIESRDVNVAVLALGNGCGSLTDMASGSGPQVAMFERPEAMSTIALGKVADFINGGGTLPQAEQVFDTGVDLVTKTAVSAVPTFTLDSVPEAIRRQCEIEATTACCTEKDKSCCPKRELQ